MVYAYQTDPDGRITMTCAPEFGEGLPTFDFPEDFDFERQSFWKIIEGELIEDTEMREKEEREEAERASEARKAVLRQEVSAAMITAAINSLDVDDATALRWRELYPVWADGIEVGVGMKLQYDGKLYKARQAHTTQIGWEPDLAASLWELVDEQHSGEIDDPIPYGIGMELTEGLYYTQGGVLYRCTRSTGVPVYNDLAELVGLYVEVAA